MNNGTPVMTAIGALTVYDSENIIRHAILGSALCFEALRARSGFLHPKIQEKAIEKISIFKENPYDSRLDTHKLHGEDKDAWAFSITDHYRIKFTFQSGDKALFLEIGTHDIYK